MIVGYCERLAGFTLSPEVDDKLPLAVRFIELTGPTGQLQEAPTYPPGAKRGDQARASPPEGAHPLQCTCHTASASPCLACCEIADRCAVPWG